MEDEQLKIERWLDAALQQYGAVDTPPGMEARLLAELRAGGPPAAFRGKWWAPVAAIATAAVIAAIWLNTGNEHRPKTPAGAAMRAFSSTAATGPAAGRATLPKAASAVSRRGRVRLSTGEGLAIARSEQPEPAQFPSPRPLTEQEKLLLTYVHQTPKQEVASVIAQQKKIRDLTITDLDVPPLEPEMPALDSNARN